MKAKEWFKSFFQGAAMGVAASVPGVSGGTIAVIVKVYDKFINAVSNLFKKFKESFLILLPIVIGMIAAIIPCMFLFDLAFEGFVFGIVCLFAGLVIGSFPNILNEVRGKERPKGGIAVLIVSCLLALGIGIVSVFLGDKINLIDLFNNPSWWFYLLLIPVGMVAALALVVPGISGSMLLLVLGFYTPLLDIATEAIKHIGQGNFWQSVLELGCFGVGVIIGFFTTAKLMSFLLNKYRLITFYGIIGFIIGSTVTLFFNNTIYTYYGTWASGSYIFMPMWLEMLLGGLLLIGGAVGAYFLIKHAEKQKLETKENAE